MKIATIVADRMLFYLSNNNLSICKVFFANSNVTWTSVSVPFQQRDLAFEDKHFIKWL